MLEESKETEVEDGWGGAADFPGTTRQSRALPIHPPPLLASEVGSQST